MSRFVLLFVCQLLLSGCWSLPTPAVPFDRSTITYAFLNQKLNHFDGLDPRTFPQRYFVSNQFQKHDGPIFLNICGEAQDLWPMTGSWIEELAPSLGALCFEIEHRYYGRPLLDPYYTYLNSEQAVHDILNFINSMNLAYNLTEKKWIVFGGSYAGSLAAWAKLKGPDIIFAAVAHSAPLEATVDQRVPEPCFRPAINIYDDPLDSTAWLNQVCKEFGWISCGHCYEEGDIEYDILKLDATCRQVVGPHFILQNALMGISHTNQMFGGKNYNASHTIFVHGSRDTWRHFGITNSSNPLMPVWTIPGAGHCYSAQTQLELSSFLQKSIIDITTYRKIQETKNDIVNHLSRWLQGESYSIYGYHNQS